MPEALKKKINRLQYQHPAKRHIRLPKALADKFRKETTKSASNKHKKPITVKINQIRKTAESIIRNRDNADWFLLVCAVVALTGRRPIEVIKIGEFTPAEHENHVTFYGQAKLRGREDTPNEIPIIGSTPKDIIETVKLIRFQRDYTDRDNDSINNSTALTLNSMLRKHFGNQDIDMRTLRTLYAIVLDKEFYEKYGSNVSKPLYLAKALGHAEDDVKTQTHYAWIVPDWDESTAYNASLNQKLIEIEVLNKLADKVEASRPAIMRFQQRGTAYEDLTNWVIEMLRKGEFVTKTAMERPDGITSQRSRKTIENFIKALKLEKGWPRKIDELFDKKSQL
jgi:hypothetical protein